MLIIFHIYDVHVCVYVIFAGKLRKNNMCNCSDELFVAKKI
jgi:hypothetical protein